MTDPAEALEPSVPTDVGDAPTHGLVPDELQESAVSATLTVREEPVGSSSVVPVLELPEELPFADLKAAIEKESENLTEAFAGRAGRLDLGSRQVDLFDLRRLIHHLEDKVGCSITGLYVSTPAIVRFAERELKLKLFLHDDGTSKDAASTTDGPEDEAPPAELSATLDDGGTSEEGDDEGDDDAVDASDPASPGLMGTSDRVDLDPDGLRTAEDAVPADDEPDAESDPPSEVVEAAGTRTLQVHRTVRSGNAVTFDGDVTIFGDVNPGAMVTASGSIVVLGALKGVAHAGATGDEEAFILGLHLQPTQLRIGRRIAIASEDRTLGPELAVVRDSRIVIEPYRSSSMARRARKR